MDCVVAYLESIHWESAEIPFDLAEIKLARIVEALEILWWPAKQPVASAQEENVAEPLVEQPKATKFGPEMEVYMDKVFAAATKTTTHKKDDKPYKPPRKKPALSEESEDDFNIDDLYEPATPAGRRKRKLVAIDSDDEVEIAGAAPQETVPGRKNASSHGKASARFTAIAPSPKKAKTTAAPSAPKVSVIEVDDDSDDDTVRKPAKRGPKCESRSHFHHPVAVEIKGNLHWEFKCKHYTRKVFISLSFTVERTRDTDKFDKEPKHPPLGNLRTHLNNHGDDLSVPGAAAELGDLREAHGSLSHQGRLRPGSNPTQKGFIKVFSVWILEDGLLFTTGETVELLSDTTIRNTLAKIYLEMFEKLKTDLKVWIVDTTRSMMFTFSGTIGSWITEDRELVERVLDFRPIEDNEHEGAFAAAAMAKHLSQNYLFACVFDNAATNDVLIRVLSRILMENFDIQFVPEKSQIRCLAHAVNLVDQKILATLNEADDPAVIDYYLPNKDLPFHYDPDADTDLRDWRRRRSRSRPMGSHDLAKLSPLQKLRMTTTKTCAYPQRRLRGAWELHTSGRKLSSLMVIRDVKHPWNFTEAMISRALLLRRAIHRWMLERDERHLLILSEEQWKILGALGVFTRVTLQMSKSTTPTFPGVIPMYENILTHLRSACANEKLQPLRVAPAAGLEKLTVYYDKARLYQFNAIATVLHP
ncbi:hypothetical protein K438DRAFT_1841322, partial [Mycena galopus ATCC 62051]